jgi:hypothetical protein
MSLIQLFDAEIIKANVLLTHLDSACQNKDLGAVKSYSTQLLQVVFKLKVINLSMGQGLVGVTPEQLMLVLEDNEKKVDDLAANVLRLVETVTTLRQAQLH